MYENLLALHTVDPSNQEVITVDDIYVASESAGTRSASKPAKKSRAPSEEPMGTLSGHYRKRNLLSHCKKIIGTLHLYNHTISRMIVFLSKKTRAKDDQGKTLDIPKR